MYLLELAGTDDAFGAYEAASVASDVSVIGAGLATARGITDRIDQLAFTHRVSSLLGTTAPSVSDAMALLEAASIERSGSVAVRARDVRGSTGVDTQRVERQLGSQLVDRGFSVELDNPDHELQAVFAGPASTSAWDGDRIEIDADGGVCALGWLDQELQRTSCSRSPTDRPFFQPGSMDPTLARVLVNIAGARPGGRLLDPMCGTGGLLLEAGRVGANVVGVDALEKMTDGTRENLAEILEEGYEVCRGDARRLPFSPDSFDAVVFDAPYGRQTKISADTLEELLADALAEARRVAPRAVVVGDRPYSEVAREVDWQVSATFTRRVHRSLDRYVHVLDRA